MFFTKFNKENRIFKIKETSDKIGICGISFVSKKSNEELECYERKADVKPENKSKK